MILLIDLTFSLVQHGMAFASIESMITELYWTRRGRNLDSENLEILKNQSYCGPSNDLLRKCFLARFMELESTYCGIMQGLTTRNWIAYDHTFKIAANVGYLRESNWVNQYNSAIFIVSDSGQVLAWQFTMGTSMDEIETLLTGVMNTAVVTKIHFW